MQPWRCWRDRIRLRGLWLAAPISCKASQGSKLWSTWLIWVWGRSRERDRVGAWVRRPRWMHWRRRKDCLWRCAGPLPRQASSHTRRRATLGGTIAASDSGPLLACLLALHGQVEVASGSQTIPLADYLAGPSETHRDRTLILALTFDARRCAGLAEIARTPADAPLLCVAVGAVPEGGRLARVTVAAGAIGQPLTLCLETAERLEGSAVGEGVALTAANETVVWRDDGRASAEYRRAMLPVLVRRACAELLAACGEVHHEG